MRRLLGLTIAALPLCAAACQPASTPAAAPAPAGPVIPAEPEGKSPPVPDILAQSKPEEWRALDPENTLYIDFPNGRVIIDSG